MCRLSSQMSQISAGQPQVLIERLCDNKRKWRPQGGQRPVSAKIDNGSHFDIDREDYDAAMQKLQERKHFLEVDWRILSEAKMEPTQNSPMSGTLGYGTDQGDVVSGIASNSISKPASSAQVMVRLERGAHMQLETPIGRAMGAL